MMYGVVARASATSPAFFGVMACMSEVGITLAIRVTTRPSPSADFLASCMKNLSGMEKISKTVTLNAFQFSI